MACIRPPIKQNIFYFFPFTSIYAGKEERLQKSWKRGVELELTECKVMIDKATVE